MTILTKWLRSIRDECEAEGIDVTIERSRKHVKIILPNGRYVTASSTPSDWRVLANVMTKVRRARV